MIHIEFVEPEDEAWIAWQQECAEATVELIRTYESDQPLQITDLYKKQKHVYVDINGPFHGKCAYCEALIAADQPGDMEHFRPKGRITDENNQPIMITNENGKAVPHPGYYWLAYNSGNLLPACEDCNRPSKRKTEGKRIGKWNYFPVAGSHAIRPSEEANEDALLINPSQEDPSQHLQIDETGILSPVPGSKKGEICIRVFGLNDREALVESRRIAYRNARSKLVRIAQALYLENLDEVAQLSQEIEQIQTGKCAFAVAARKGLEDDRNLLAPLKPLL